MELALYAAGAGLLRRRLHQVRRAGDFVTAPEISSLFSSDAGTPGGELLDLAGGEIVELGAGSGRMAADLLLTLDALGHCRSLRHRGAERRAAARQRQRLASVAGSVLRRACNGSTRCPSALQRLILANEVLDALPVHLVVWYENGVIERGVSGAATDSPALTARSPPAAAAGGVPL